MELRHQFAHTYPGYRCLEGIAALQSMTPLPADRVVCSPMRRCLETAARLYPGQLPIIEPQFRETDFGAFEGLSYLELNGRTDYQRWVDSGGELPFPGGESLSLMQERVESAFRRLCESSPDETVAVVAHGGTIMAIMSRFAKPAQPYYFYQVGNGEGFVLETDGSWRRL